MKIQKLIGLVGLCVGILSFSSFTNYSNTIHSNNTMLFQEGLIVYATYSGQDDYGYYNFITKNKNGKETTLTFQNIEEPVLSVFDLSMDTFVGTKFKVTFTRDFKKTSKGEDLEDQLEINTITNLEEL